MSSFACPTCHTAVVDHLSVGYVSGCCHYPPEHSRLVNVWFGGDREKPTRAFYRGGWYRSERARREGLAVHPVRWAE